MIKRIRKRSHKKDLYINGHNCFIQYIPESGSGTIYDSAKPLIHKINANRTIVKKRKKENLS